MAITEEEFLEHYGVGGMRWGVRKGNSSRSVNRAKNKASRQKDKAKYVKDIEKARGKFDSGKAQGDYKKAKAQFKVDKKELGSREARKILYKAREKRDKDYETSIQAKNGKEFATQVLAGVAASYVIGKVLSR